MTDVTHILNQIEQGDPSAADELLPLVYEELRRLAGKKLVYEKPGQSLQATALVHEAYLRLVGNDHECHWDSRGHFFAAASEAMRRILVDKARRAQRIKRGGQFRREELDECKIDIHDPSTNVLAIDEALNKLNEKYPETAELIKLRFFAGMTVKEAARVMGIATSTADRHWAFARAWLRREIVPEDQL